MNALAGTAPDAVTKAFSIADTAKSIGVSRSHLYKLIADGKGPPAITISRGRKVVLISDRDAWLEKLRHSAKKG